MFRARPCHAGVEQFQLTQAGQLRFTGHEYRRPDIEFRNALLAVIRTSTSHGSVCSFAATAKVPDSAVTLLAKDVANAPSQISPAQCPLYGVATNQAGTNMDFETGTLAPCDAAQCWQPTRALRCGHIRRERRRKFVQRLPHCRQFRDTRLASRKMLRCSEA